MNESMGQDDLNLPLALGARALEGLLELNQNDLRWIPQEFGSSCGDALRSDLACQTIRWLDDALTEKFVLNHQSASRVMNSGRVLKPLLTMAESVHRTRRFELVRTVPLHCDHHLPSNIYRTFAALALAVDKPEDHGFGYHLHPLDEQENRHLGYKLLFDPAQGQSWMSWELHGQGNTPWGVPSRAVLGAQRSKILYRTALYSVRGSVIAPSGTSFISWSSHFERPGRTAFIAHPQVGTATQWPRT
jgi:hypothetical protein